MLLTEGHGSKFVRRVGAELDIDAGREAAIGGMQSLSRWPCRHRRN
jgi:hypothetical protein